MGKLLDTLFPWRFFPIRVTLYQGEIQWVVANVCTFVGPKIAMPNGCLPTATDKQVGKCNVETIDAKFHGRLLELKPDYNASSR